MTDADAYREIRTFATDLGGKPLTVAYRPALDDRTNPDPAEALLASQATLQSDERVLISPCGRGALAAWATTMVGATQVTAMDTNAIALELTRLTLNANDAAQANVLAGLPAAGNGPFDVALLRLPKGRQLSRLHLLHTALSLQPGGQLYVAGANNEGIKSVLADAELLLGRGVLLAYRKGHRVARFTRDALDINALPEPFNAPGLHPDTFEHYEVAVGQRHLTVCSQPGVFSHGQLDDGTAILLDHLTLEPHERVLDLGCGAGIIGIVMALTVGAPQVTLVDVDTLACDCARASLAANGLVGAQVLLNDGLANVAPASYDFIVSNPPFHAGHAVNLATTTALIAEAYQALTVGGRLMIVANRFLPYDRAMLARFGEVTTLYADGRYHLLAATRTARR